ncbi:MAG: two-component system, NarL family, sensor histidine kinase BarA [Pyrinomonadaceae bacterium]|nr:two-component system, NarL family, sensor histidine kinase BarA [Pyrinomonadaceae bacterium]
MSLEGGTFNCFCRMNARAEKSLEMFSGGGEAAQVSDELNALGAEVVDIFYAQVFAPGEYATEAAVCAAFSEILLRHWNLCCLITYLRGEDGRLRESAMHAHPHMDEADGRRVGQRLAEFVEASGRECHVWLDEAAAGDAVADEARALFAETGIKAGLALPITARGSVIGALVAVSSHPERLRAADRGLHFIAAPLVIALGNARRAAAMREQREQIEQLVEELRERGGALEEANLELQRVARYRSLFLARMSHELRTPLTAILGFSEILLEHENLTPKQQSFCEKIQSSGLKLKSSLKQLVDLSRLEAGQAELFLHEFYVREMLRETCGAVARLAEKKDVTLDCTTAPDCGTVVSDEGKLRQVLYNFFAHAIGRSPEGATVHVYAFKRTPSELCIEISDEGEPLADAAHIFDAVEMDAPNENGTNLNELGLVIAQRLVAVLDGRTTLDTAAPRGLTVRLELPAYPTKEQ